MGCFGGIGDRISTGVVQITAPSPSQPQLIPVRLVNQLLMLPIGEDGVITIPLGAAIDIELTGLLIDIMRRHGVPEDELEEAMNELRVQYVMGPSARVADVSAYLDKHGVGGGEEIERQREIQGSPGDTGNLRS